MNERKDIKPETKETSKKISYETKQIESKMKKSDKIDTCKNEKVQNKTDTNKEDSCKIDNDQNINVVGLQNLGR